MSYKNKQDQRDYQRQWWQYRRLAWLIDNGPCKACGKWYELEVDHINPLEKTSHRVWSWSEARRKEELAKCQVLCRTCHQQKFVRNKEYEIRKSTAN